MATATVSSKGQIVIPRSIREAYGIQAGDRLDFSTHEGHIHVTKRENALQAFLAGPKMRLERGQVEKVLKERF